MSGILERECARAAGGPGLHLRSGTYIIYNDTLVDKSLLYAFTLKGTYFLFPLSVSWLPPACRRCTPRSRRSIQTSERRAEEKRSSGTSTPLPLCFSPRSSTTGSVWTFVCVLDNITSSSDRRDSPPRRLGGWTPSVPAAGRSSTRRRKSAAWTRWAPRLKTDNQGCVRMTGSPTQLSLLSL